MPDAVKNKIKFGLCDVMYALATETQDASTGKWTTSYGSYKAVPGAVNLSLSPEGQDDNFYADNIIYAVLASNQGYSGTAEFAMLTADVEKDLLQRDADSNGVITESAEKVVPPVFAMSFRIDGDKKNRRYVLYRCTMTRPDIGGATKEQSITPNTDTVNFKAQPRPDDGLVFAHTSDDTPAAIVDGWNDEVYVPDAES